ncbi:MAG: hypothetical protein AAFP90_08055, partial [Planctomycetota bacterium]
MTAPKPSPQSPAALRSHLHCTSLAMGVVGQARPSIMEVDEESDSPQNIQDLTTAFLAAGQPGPHRATFNASAIPHPSRAGVRVLQIQCKTDGDHSIVFVGFQSTWDVNAAASLGDLRRLQQFADTNTAEEVLGNADAQRDQAVASQPAGFASRMHDDLQFRATCQRVADTLRRVIGGGRVSVLVGKRASGLRLMAVSGVDTIDHGGDFARTMVRLARKTAATNAPFDFPASS